MIVVFQPQSRAGMWRARRGEVFSTDWFDNPCDAIEAFQAGKTVKLERGGQNDDVNWRTAKNGSRALRARGMTAVVKQARGGSYFALIDGVLVPGWHPSQEAAETAAEREMLRRYAERTAAARHERDRYA